MRKAMQIVGAMLLMLVPTVAVAQAPSASEPLKLKTLLEAPTTAVPAPTGSAQHDLNVGTENVITVSPAAVGECLQIGPSSCPEPPRITGFADLTAPWSAERMDGRVLVVRNAGPGVVVLRGEDAGSTDVWRLASSRALGADDVVLLVYDASKGRWQILGSGSKPTSGPHAAQ